MCLTLNATPGSATPGMGDEFPLAEQTALQLGNVDVQRIRAGPEDWLEDSDQLSRAGGILYGNPANLGWLRATYAAARTQGATALLDSTFGNQTVSWRGEAALPALIAQGRFAEVFALLGQIRSNLGGTGAFVLLRALSSFAPATIADPLAALRGHHTAARAAFVRPEHRSTLKALDEIRAIGGWTRRYRPIRTAQERLNELKWADFGSHAVAVRRLYGLELCDPFAAKPLVELTLRIEDHRFFEKGRGRAFARRLLRNRVPDAVTDGVIEWQQGIDWKQRVLQTSDAILAEFDFAERETDLGELMDIPRMRDHVHNWSASTDAGVEMTMSGFVLRAVTAIRFTRWAGALK